MWAAIGAFTGLIAGFVLPAQYTSTTSLLPELQENQAMNLKSVQELAESIGLDFDAGPQVEAVRPDLYPDILESAPFALSMLHHPVTLRTKQHLPLHQLLTESAWPFRADSVTKLPRPTEQPIRLTTSQRELVDELKLLIKAHLDPKTGIMTISAHMPDPEVAAQVVQFSANYLQAFVRAYRTDKARENEQFVRGQLEEARQHAYQLEQAMLAHQDETRFLSLPSASLPNRRLSSQYEAANALFGELKRELAKANLRVQTIAPVFKVLEPAQVPDRKSSPRRVWLVLAGAVSGLALGVLYRLIRSGIFVPV
ncbi:MAG: hypothetical protein LH609_06285 [Rudanella sp.]|nr:hypothetical protein [Rudanella sp.]